MTGDVYVLIPGITGSVLEKDGRDAFGLTAEAGLRALFSAGGSLGDLRLDGDAVEADDLGDGVRATRLAPDAHLIPGLWKIDGYGAVGAWLRRRLGLVPGDTYFEFPYDWRRDNRVAARRLAAAAAGWLAARRERDPEARLVLIGHSMGGLVARYFLEVLEGWRETRTLITFGTPYRGSLNAVDFLVNGSRKLHGLVDLTELVRSFTSVYQLLPVYRCLDAGTGALVRLVEAPGVVPDLDADRVEAARGFHREIEEAVARHRDEPGYLAHGYDIRPVVGIEQPTSQAAAWRGGALSLERTYEGREIGGDGTVPRVAALPQEHDDDGGAMFASARHAGLQNADPVLIQVRGWLTGIDLGPFRGAPPVGLALDVEDVTRGGEPVRATVSPSAATGALEASLEWVAGPGPGPAPRTVPVPVAPGGRPVEFPAVGPGCYRLRVSGGDDVEPVSDLIVVSPA